MSNLPHIGAPNKEHAPNYAGRYFDIIEDATDLLNSLEVNKSYIMEFMRSIPSDKGTFAYQEGKWTVKEVFSHINDTERIFQYRALRFGRNDNTSLPGFEENDYVPFTNANLRTIADFAEEFEAIRNSTIALFRTFALENYDFVANSNGSPMSARSAGWLCIGHALHHTKVIQERYL